MSLAAEIFAEINEHGELLTEPSFGIEMNVNTVKLIPKAVLTQP